MEAKTKAVLLTLLIIADGVLTWASITAGLAREANPFFEDARNPLWFVPFAFIKAFLWVGVWFAIRDHKWSGAVASGLAAVYGGLFVWNVGNVAVTL